MPNPIPITAETMGNIVTQLHMACESEKPFQCLIQSHDDSLKARQRALANIWYGEIDTAQNSLPGEAESYCKYWFGFSLACRNDPDLRTIIRKMLDGHTYENKLIIIRQYPEWFPVLRDKGGLNSERLAEYLNAIQGHFAKEGIYLTTPKERELLNCRAANV